MSLTLTPALSMHPMKMHQVDGLTLYFLIQAFNHGRVIFHILKENAQSSGTFYTYPITQVYLVLIVHSTQQDSPCGRLPTCGHNSSVDDVVRSQQKPTRSERVLEQGSSYRVLQGSEFLCSSHLRVPIEVNDLQVLCCDTGSTHAGLTTCSTLKS